LKSKDGRFLKLTTRNRRLVCGSAPLVARIRRPSSEFFPVRQRRVRFDGDDITNQPPAALLAAGSPMPPRAQRLRAGDRRGEPPARSEQRWREV